MIIRTWILLSLATLAAAAPAKWRQSYDAGYFDAQGKWAGGSEIMHLAAHAGSLYAANGYWLDARWVIPPEGQKQSAQVLRLDKANGQWQVDLDLGKANDLGSRELGETLRFWTISIGDFLDEHFDNDLMKAHLAGSGIIGTGLGVYSPGTAYVLLHHYMGDVDGAIGAWGFARGGMGAVSGALAGALKSSGGEIRTAAEVVNITVSGNRATGVELATGEKLAAKIVVSNLDARRTFTQVMNENDLPPRLVRAAKNFKIRGSSGKLNIALDGMPTFPSLPKGSPLTLGHMHFTDTLRRLEKAYDDWKDDRWSADPYCDTLIPSQYDPSLAPPGKHMMTVFVQYCPVEPDGGWTDEKRDQFGQTVIDQIADYSPDFKDLLLHAEIRTPRELEDEVGLTEGNIFQGELTFDQLLFNRPFPGYAQYRSPIKGMYMCSSGTHPGGGVMAAPGANAAREILADLKKPNTVPGGYADD